MQNLEFVIISTGLTLEVMDFLVEEQMNTPFSAVLSVRSYETLDLASLIGQSASFVAELRGFDGRSAVWTGIIADIEEISNETTGICRYRVDLRHPLWVLSQNSNYRIFQHLSELDIARTLLREWQLTDQPRLDVGQYKKRDFRIQYGESDLDFLCRNLEDVGVSFYVETTDEGELLMLADAPQRNEARASLRFYDEPPLSAPERWASAVHVLRAVKAARYTIQDVDHRLPSDRQPRLTSSLVDETKDTPPALRVSPLERGLETYEYNPGIFAVEGKAAGDTPAADRKQATRTDDKYGKWLTEVRLRSVQAARYRVRFTTNGFDLRPGTVTRIEQHPRPELDGNLLIIATSFEGSEGGEWTLKCTAQPCAIPYVPEFVTPRPTASGVETATVVGTPGKQIDAQESGSVLVHFHWDRQSNRDDNSSCWVPVSYGLAGPGRGMFSLPRVGEEVLVDFLAGDLDKPMITGRIYTGINKPWTSDVSKMGDFSIKNDSLEDPAQNTGILMTADQKPLLNLFTTHDKQVTVGNDERATVQGNRSRHVGGGETVNIGNNQNIHIKDSFNQRVEGNSATVVDGEIALTSNAGSINAVAATGIGLLAPTIGVASSAITVLSCGRACIVILPNEVVIDAPKVLINPGLAFTKFVAENGGIPEEPVAPTVPPEIVDPKTGSAVHPETSRQAKGSNDTPAEVARKEDLYAEYRAAQEEYLERKREYKDLMDQIGRGENPSVETWKNIEKGRTDTEMKGLRDQRRAARGDKWLKPVE